MQGSYMSILHACSSCLNDYIASKACQVIRERRPFYLRLIGEQLAINVEESD